MHQKLLLAALAVLLVIMVTLDRGQGTPAAEPAAGNDKAVCPVAMVDLTKVFKQHARFADHSEAMRKEVEAAEGEVKAQHKAYDEQLSKLKSMKPGTDDHRRLSAELKNTAETLNAQVERQKAAFLRQEAAIYSEVFEQIEAAIREYASRRGIKLVLRFNGERLDRTNPEEVLKEMNKSVLYQDGIDITNDILEMVNGRG